MQYNNCIAELDISIVEFVMVELDDIVPFVVLFELVAIVAGIDESVCLDTRGHADTTPRSAKIFIDASETWTGDIYSPHQSV